MIVIDVEALNSPRYAQPQISFRRTEADRKPSRPFVRPNDTAPTWEEREAESARRLQAITVKRVEAQRIFTERLDVPKVAQATDTTRQVTLDRKGADRMKIAILRALAGGAETCADIQTLGICSKTNALKISTKLRLSGLVSATRVSNPTAKAGQTRFAFALTDAGREAIKTGVVPE